MQEIFRRGVVLCVLDSSVDDCVMQWWQAWVEPLHGCNIIRLLSFKFRMRCRLRLPSSELLQYSHRLADPLVIQSVKVASHIVEASTFDWLFDGLTWWITTAEVVF